MEISPANDIPEPTPTQLFIARNGPWVVVRSIALGAGAIGMAGWLLATVGVPTTASGWFLLLFSPLVAALLAMMVAGIVSLFILGPIYYHQGLCNGAPFEPGDEVRVLVGKHAGRVARVYKVWEERAQVRVELGEEEKEKVTDVFGYIEVMRVPASMTDKGPGREDRPGPG